MTSLRGLTGLFWRLKRPGLVPRDNGPTHYFTLGRGGSGSRPRVIAHTVERLTTEVQRGQRDVGTPRGVVETTLEVGVESVFAGVPAGTVTAVVSQGDGVGQGDVKTHGARDARGDLGHFERVREAGAHVIVGEDEDLGLARESSKRRRVQDAVPVTFETGAVGVRLLRANSVTRPHGPSGTTRQPLVAEDLARFTRRRSYEAIVVTVDGGHGIVVGAYDIVVDETLHGRRPLGVSLAGRVVSHDHHLAPTP